MANHNLHDEQKVWLAYGKGHGKRQISRDTGIPYSTVWGIIDRIEKEGIEPRQPRILFYDIESSLMRAVLWRTGQQYVSASSITQDWFIHCCALKFKGEKCAVTSQIDDKERFKADCTDDYHVVKKMHEAFSKADVVVAHNGDRFDWKKFMARAIYHRLPPLKQPRMIDTLKIARKAGFTSKRLGDLAIKFKIDQKAANDFAWWLGALDGCVESHKKMKHYCALDIPPMEKLLDILAPYYPKMIPNYNVLSNGDGMACPCCGSENIIRDGEIMRGQTSMVAAYNCKACGAWFDDGKNMRKGVVFRA